ncbi:MAG: hypothetical protein ABL907_20890 [Hyphomicrobium sp.]
MQNRQGPPDKTTLAVLLSAGLAMAWLITTHTLASYLADVAPEKALIFRSSEPIALIRLAERSVPQLLEPASGALTAANAEPVAAQSNPQSQSSAQPQIESVEGSRLGAFAKLPRFDTGSPEDMAAAALQPKPPAVEEAQIHSWSERALLANPTGARGLSILGILMARDGNEAQASAFMSAATRRSAREPIANYWMLSTAFEAKDYAQATVQADVLLRHTRNIRLVAPFLGRLAETDAATEALSALMERNPPWRAAFFQNLKGNIKDARTPITLLLKLKDTPNPPVFAEINPYVALLIENNYYDLAYNAWLQFLDAEQLSKAGFIFNGDFNFAPSGYPFDWTVTPGAGVIMEVGPAPDDSSNKVLKIALGPGRVNYRPVRQMTMLVPGDYTLTARFKGEIRARRGLKWSVSCARPSLKKLGEGSEINGSNPAWTGVVINFTVPKEDCRAQTVQLSLDARSASETLVSGTLLIDAVAIARRGEAELAQ